MAISTIGSNSISGLGYGFKNRIINGACAIFQRNTNLSTNNSYGYYVDRYWGFSESGTAATFSQASSTGLTGFPYAVRMQRNASNASTNILYTGQIIESNNLQDLQGQSVSISFYARAGANFSASGSVLKVWLRSGTTADQGLTALISGWAGAADQTSNVTLTTSWQRFTVTTFTVPSNCQELTSFFSFTPVGTAGAADYVDITGIQLEKGNVTTSFDYRPYGTELALCQRYYYRKTSWNSLDYIGNMQAYSTGGVFGVLLYLPVELRTSNGTVGLSSATHIAPYIANGSTSPAFSSANTVLADTRCIYVTGSLSGSSGLAAGNCSVIYFNTTSGWIDVSSEL